MIDVGPGVEELLGISRSDFLSSPLVWADAIHPDDRERVIAASAHSVATGEEFRLEYRARHPDGTVKWIREESQLVYDGDGEALYWLGIMLDVTDLAMTQHQLAGGADQVRGARGADPRHRLHGSRRRSLDHHVREPADRVPPRVHARGVRGRLRSLGPHAPSRRPRGDPRRVRTGARRGRSVRPGVPAHRAGRARALVPRQRDRAARPAGAPPTGAGRDARHHRAEGGRGADRVPRLPRQTDGTPEPCHVRRTAGPRPEPGSADERGRRRDQRRPGRLQAGERLARTRRRRRTDRSARRQAARGHPRHRPRGAPGRRRVPRVAGGPGPNPSHARGAGWGHRSPRKRSRCGSSKRSTPPSRSPAPSCT